MPTFYTPATQPIKTLVAGATGTFIHTGANTIVHLQIAAGTVVPMHNHVHTQLTKVLAGSLEVELANGQKHLVTAGESIFFDSNEAHKVVCLSTAEVIDVFSPEREDFK
jgi:quercetin dioxygenase-like cupin family protein